VLRRSLRGHSQIGSEARAYAEAWRTPWQLWARVHEELRALIVGLLDRDFRDALS
jgi:hypothetical protein